MALEPLTAKTAPSGTADILFDNIAGVGYIPIGKMDIGADGASSPVTTANPLPVTFPSTPTVTVSGVATSANQTTEQTLIGAVAETAPGTDTASSGLNGRLQRIAQRLTSLIALLPSSLGQKTSANSLAVVIASDQSDISTNVNRALSFVSSTITNGQTVGADTTITAGKTIEGIFLPSGYDGTALTFQMSPDGGTTWVAVKDPADGTSVTWVVAASGFYQDRYGDLRGISRIKLVSGTVQSTTDTVCSIAVR